ncbi:unnamed protein product [[Candida] boidinii]|nr:unnamed protein product [[Candida] boidinii]
MLNTKIELQLDDMEDSIMHRMGDSKQDSGNNSPNGDNERDEDVEGDAEADAEGEAFPEPIIDRGEMIEQNDQEYNIQI